MPNHCSNDLFVNGPLSEVERFIAEVVKQGTDGGYVLDCDAILPYPLKFKEMDEARQKWEDDYRTFLKEQGVAGWSALHAKEFIRTHGERPIDGFNSGGYEWCVENWGTKWGCYRGSHKDVDVNGDVAQLAITFDTAWSPLAESMYERLSARFPTLTIRNEFFECGMGFRGHSEWLNGKCISWDQSDDYRGERGG